MQKYTRHSVVPISLILPLIKANMSLPEKGKDSPRVEVNEVMVRVTSLRLRTFLKSGTKCHCCGMEATHFAIEKDAKTKEPFFHLNLYGTDPVLGEILFTHDHIIALSKGGPDNLSNTQTMCGPCNWRKSDK